MNCIYCGGPAGINTVDRKEGPLHYSRIECAEFLKSEVKRLNLQKSEALCAELAVLRDKLMLQVRELEQKLAVRTGTANALAQEYDNVVQLIDEMKRAFGRLTCKLEKDGYNGMYSIEVSGAEWDEIRAPFHCTEKRNGAVCWCSAKLVEANVVCPIHG